MNNKHLVIKISVMAVLILTVVGLSGYPTSASHPRELAQPASARSSALNKNVAAVDDPDERHLRGKRRAEVGGERVRGE